MVCKINRFKLAFLLSEVGDRDIQYIFSIFYIILKHYSTAKNIITLYLYIETSHRYILFFAKNKYFIWELSDW